MLSFGGACCHCWCHSGCLQSKLSFFAFCVATYSCYVVSVYFTYHSGLVIFTHIHLCTSYKLRGLNWVSVYFTYHSRLVIFTHIHPCISYRLRGLNWVSKNRRAAHDVEFVLGSTKKDPKDTPDHVFNNFACSISFGTEGGSIKEWREPIPSVSPFPILNQPYFSHAPV